MRVSYDKDVRAKAHEKPYVGLACVDIYPWNGTRYTSQSPCTQRDLDELREFLFAWQERCFKRWKRRNNFK